MNINLSAAVAKQKSKKRKNNNNPLDNSNVSYGLNRRGGGQSVFEDEDTDDDDNGATSSANNGRDEVNRSIAAEQAALRKRAQAAMVSNSKTSSSNIYDYDGAYDSIQSQRESDKQQAQAAQTQNRGSRYVSDLLRAAKNRERERDVIYERKLAREQQEEEDANEEYKGKEKFVTKAYKRKLAERQLWLKEQEEKRIKEEQDDVSKKIDGKALASFYGNLNRNVAMGGSEQAPREEESKEKDHPFPGDNDVTEKRISQQHQDSRGGLGFLEGFERSEQPKTDHETVNQQVAEEGDYPKENEETKRALIRKAREEKVAQARIRYFRRHGVTDIASDTKQ